LFSSCLHFEILLDYKANAELGTTLEIYDKAPKGNPSSEPLVTLRPILFSPAHLVYGLVKQRAYFGLIIQARDSSPQDPSSRTDFTQIPSQGWGCFQVGGVVCSLFHAGCHIYIWAGTYANLFFFLPAFCSERRCKVCNENEIYAFHLIEVHKCCT